MAAGTLTPSRFSISHTGNHAPYSSMAPSMAETLPTIDFNFNDLRDRMAQFTARFDDFIERGRKRVLEERNAFRMNLADAGDQQRHRRQAINELESKSSSHAHTLAREAQEAEEMHEAIQSLTLQKEEHNARRENVRSEIASVHSAIKQRKDAQAAHQCTLNSQARNNLPELRLWQDCLGMRLEGTGIEDRLKFVFETSKEQGFAEECWFELQLSKVQKVVGTKPRLERANVEGAEEALQETRQLGVFIKTMRQLLLEAVKR